MYGGFMLKLENPELLFIAALNSCKIFHNIFNVLRTT